MVLIQTIGVFKSSWYTCAMSFSNEQIAAIHHVKGPAMVLAGPGSGKTTVITHRIMHLLSIGVPPDRILVITFTKDAATEMEARFKKLLAGDSKKTAVSSQLTKRARLLSSINNSLLLEIT